MSRSVRDQSRETSGSSRWFIQISSLVASLMKVTKPFKWLTRSTEHFYEKKFNFIARETITLHLN